MSYLTNNSYIPWLRAMAKKGGKGGCDNVDARGLGRVADEIERLATRVKELGEMADVCIYDDLHEVCEYCRCERRTELNAPDSQFGVGA